MFCVYWGEALDKANFMPNKISRIVCELYTPGDKPGVYLISSDQAAIYHGINSGTSPGKILGRFSSSMFSLKILSAHFASIFSNKILASRAFPK